MSLISGRIAVEVDGEGERSVRRIHDRQLGVEREIDGRAFGDVSIAGAGNEEAFHRPINQIRLGRMVAIARQHTEGIGVLAEASAAIVPLMRPVCELIDNPAGRLPMTEYVSVVP